MTKLNDEDLFIDKSKISPWRFWAIFLSFMVIVFFVSVVFAGHSTNSREQKIQHVRSACLADGGKFSTEYTSDGRRSSYRCVEGK